MKINNKILEIVLDKENVDKEQLTKMLSIANNWRSRIASACITELADNEVFVFGSDVKGNHLGGAAGWALSKKWAKLGQYNGVNDKNNIKSYAITTTDFYEGEGRASEENKFKEPKANPGDIEKEMIKSINNFIDYAGEHSEKTFLVTSIGTGLAGFTVEEMAKKFRGAVKLKNVHLPMSFWLFYSENKYPDGKTPSDMVPCKSKPVNEFQDELNHQLALYCQWLRTKLEKQKTTDDNDTKIKIRRIIMTVERYCDSINNAVDRMYRGLPSEAYQELIKHFKEDNKDYIQWQPTFFDCPEENETEPSEKKGTFYRLREERDNWAKRDVDVRGMFHLPYNLRHLASTQRYSVPGYPSMYMGEHVFSCWEERGRPNLSNCLISRIESQKTFKVLDLTIPKPETWDTIDIDKPYQALLFPFIIASSFKAYSNTAAFKPEYIIPQLLFQYVKNYAYNQNRDKDNESVEVYGIKYTSVHFPGYEKPQLDRSQYDNYVVPAISTKNLYCRHLCELFHITKPFCEDYARIGETKADSSSTIFDKIEDILKDKNIYELYELKADGSLN